SQSTDSNDADATGRANQTAQRSIDRDPPAKQRSGVGRIQRIGHRNREAAIYTQALGESAVARKRCRTRLRAEILRIAAAPLAATATAPLPADADALADREIFDFIAHRDHGSDYFMARN